MSKKGSEGVRVSVGVRVRVRVRVNTVLSKQKFVFFKIGKTVVFLSFIALLVEIDRIGAVWCGGTSLACTPGQRRTSACWYSIVISRVPQTVCPHAVQLVMHATFSSWMMRGGFGIYSAYGRIFSVL
jgi:hypothetical protein